MGIKVLGCTVLLSIFTVGSVMNNVSGALGNNQTVANVAENFDSKTNADNKKQDSSNENHGQKDNSKGLVFFENNEGNPSNLNRNLALGGTGVACLAGGVALGIKAIGKGKEEVETIVAVKDESGFNVNESKPERNHASSVDSGTIGKESTASEKSENTVSDVAIELFTYLFLAFIVVFFGSCGFCCFCGHPEILCAAAQHAINSGNSMPTF